MDLKIALLLYLFIAIIVYIIARLYRITVLSSIVLALLLSIIVLSVIYPVSAVEKIFTKNYLLLTYTFIQMLTSFIILWYLIYKILSDRECISHIDVCPI